MSQADLPLFSMLRSRMSYLTERQKLISENVANASTPGYVSQDLKPFKFEMETQSAAASAAQAMSTSGGMLAPGARTGSKSNFKTIQIKGSETTLDGNAVVLEEEMLKMTDSRVNYEAAISFYQKSLNLLRMAAKPPGR